MTYFVWALLAVSAAYWGMRLFGGWVGKSLGSPSALPAGQVVTVAAVPAMPLAPPAAAAKPPVLSDAERGDGAETAADFKLEGILYNSSNPGASRALIVLPSHSAAKTSGDPTPNGALVQGGPKGAQSYAIGSKLGTDAVLVGIRPDAVTLRLANQAVVKLSLPEKKLR